MPTERSATSAESPHATQGATVPSSAAPVLIPWPRWSRYTAKGAESQAQRAGHLVPWLSLNGVNRMPPPLYHEALAAWRTQAALACMGWGHIDPTGAPFLVTIALFKATSHEMDPAAVWEGAKPIIDGLVDGMAGHKVLPGDTGRIIGPVRGLATKAAHRQECRVEITFTPWR